ncbi:MAG: hypothetical protein MI724_14510, partial [Spirochaetales bacterium]|nr:hypothetical protein [Spirochaetales bacterium]
HVAAFGHALKSDRTFVADSLDRLEDFGVVDLAGSRFVAVGRVGLREQPPYRQQSPIVHGDGTVTFMFSFDLRVSPTVETVDGRQLSVRSIRDPRINLVGTFNGWDPFMHRLVGPDENGFYSLRIPVSEGSHYYYFVINGHRVLDSLNRERARDLQTDALTNLVVVRR